ncbi:MAG: citrate lyase holo-[acyl-carrier protein] synthase [Oscillospiraceae bacterium]
MALTSMENVLLSREIRWDRQLALLQEYNLPLLSFTLNIAGPVKLSGLIYRTFCEGKALILKICSDQDWDILYQEEKCLDTGPEALFAVNADAKSLKVSMLKLESESSLGRLFDLDVLDIGGKKLSRSDFGYSLRRCLLCDRPAAACGRTRAHGLEALIFEQTRIQREYFEHKNQKIIARLAEAALIQEAYTTPKPGLVDLRNNGAHTDMTMDLMVKSAKTLAPWFGRFYLLGIRQCAAEYTDIMQALRAEGILAEKEMLCATDGVNTHKGAVFSMGLLCCAAGILYGRGLAFSMEYLQNICRELAADLLHEFDAITVKNARTHGEVLYAQFGLTGIRGEAAAGFPSAFQIGLPRLRQLLSKGLDYDKAGALTLLSILSNFCDTNVVYRSGPGRLYELQREIRVMLTASPPLEDTDYFPILIRLDERMIAENISPGGSADMLALVYFLHNAEDVFSGQL